MQNLRTRKDTSKSALLLAGDLVCFLVFALLGLRSHEDGITASSVLRAAVPFQAGWLLVNLALLRRGTRLEASTDLGRSVVLRWLPAWALGLALRSLIFGRAFAPTFAVISFLFNAVLLVAWRVFAQKRLGAV